MVRKRRAALRWGNICGGVAAALVLVHEVFADAIMNATIANTILAAAVFLILCLMLFFAAGVVAAHQTGSAGAGALAGLIAGAVAGGVVLLLGLYVNLVHTPLPTPTGHSTVTLMQYHLDIILRVLLIYVVLALVLAGCGAGFGAMGGVAGRPITHTAPPADPSSPAALQPSAQERVAASTLDAPILATSTVATAMPDDGGAALSMSTMAAEDVRIESE